MKWIYVVSQVTVFGDVVEILLCHRQIGNGHAGLVHRDDTALARAFVHKLAAHVGIPPMVAGLPRQLEGQRLYHVEDGVADDHVVIDTDYGGDYNHTVTNTWMEENEKIAKESS